MGFRFLRKSQATIPRPAHEPGPANPKAAGPLL